MTSRTPTPVSDLAWSPRTTHNCWHEQWIAHLTIQTELNPNHPGKADLKKYIQAAQRYHDDDDYFDDWEQEITEEEETTRHELVAALNVYNRRAGADTAHLGLTSHDIVDATTQHQIRDNLLDLVALARMLERDVLGETQPWDNEPIVARTHGQPAQLTTIGHRKCTIASPLRDWIERAIHWTNCYPMRPPYGAVGTGADLERVLTGWGNHPGPSKTMQRVVDDLAADAGLTSGQLDQVLAGFKARGFGITQLEGGVPPGTSPLDGDRLLATYVHRLAKRYGYMKVMACSRQTYHRSYDLGLAALLCELASIAETWATDRRLEAMLGLGNETRGSEQVGSSAMPHKTNPVLAERICSLAALARGHLTTAASLAPNGWLEGDVSTSGARRELYPAMFSNIEAILLNWIEAAKRWDYNLPRVRQEIHTHRVELITGHLLQWAVEQGIPRAQAHETLMGRMRELKPRNLVGLAEELSEAWGRKVPDEALCPPKEQIGNIGDQLRQLQARIGG